VPEMHVSAQFLPLGIGLNAWHFVSRDQQDGSRRTLRGGLEMVAIAFLILILAAPGAAQSVPQTPSASDRAQFSNVELRVTDRAGAPLESARINIDGITPYERETGSLGRVTFLKVRCGTYIARVERDGYVPLDREFTVIPGRTTVITASLSPARPRPVTVLGQLSAPSIPGFVDSQYIGR
jgi:hypothetical protein